MIQNEQIRPRVFLSVVQRTLFELGESSTSQISGVSLCLNGHTCLYSTKQKTPQKACKVFARKVCLFRFISKLGHHKYKLTFLKRHHYRGMTTTNP